MKELLEEIKSYIERVEEQIDGEWGSCQSIGELIANNEMPDIYWKVIESINNL